jgi:two-component system cell cycle response regulator DivK
VRGEVALEAAHEQRHDLVDVDDHQRRPGLEARLVDFGRKQGVGQGGASRGLNPRLSNLGRPTKRILRARESPARWRRGGMARSILIIEDNELNMKLFRDVLAAQGYEVLESREGLRGFEMARQQRPDLIIMDIQLPAISGLEVTRWLKEDSDLSRIPVVAVTAYAMKGDEARIREGGCEAYMAKPISVARLLETVGRLIERASEGA